MRQEEDERKQREWRERREKGREGRGRGGNKRTKHRINNQAPFTILDTAGNFFCIINLLCGFQ